MALPLLDQINDRSARLSVRAGPAVLSLLADRNIIGVEAQKFRGLGGMFQAAKDLKSRQFNACFLTDRSFRSALTVRLANIPIRVGHGTEGRGWLLTHRTPYSATESEIQSGLDLLTPFATPDRSLKPTLGLVQHELRSKSLPWPNAIAYQPGARYASKQYPVDRLAKVAVALARPAVVLGGKEEVESASDFLQMIGQLPVLNQVGQTTLRESMVMLKSVQLCIGSDTGLMHIAAALGTPTLSLFGPNPASKWAHDYAPHRFLTAHLGDLTSISDAEVLELAKTMLEGV